MILRIYTKVKYQKVVLRYYRLKEQEESLANRVELQDKDIVFLYVSVDDKEEDCAFDFDAI